MTSRGLAGASLIGATLTMVCLFGLGIGPERLEIYVSKDGHDSWSGHLPLPAGSRDGPFATLERAKKEVRAAIANGLKKDIVVYIRGGVYYLQDGLFIGPEDSGSKIHSVTYAAYPGEDVSIVGGIEVSGWGDHGDGLWWTSVPNGTEPSQLFEDGWRMELARSPNYGYFEIQRAVEGRETEAFVYSAEDINLEGSEVAGGRVFVWQGHDWYSSEKAIISIDSQARIISMDSDEGYPMTPGNRYFVRNVLGLLDLPGECQINLESKRIYCRPRNEPIAERTMLISTAQNVIRLNGAENSPVRNVHFENLDLGICNGDVFLASGLEDCSIKFCKIENGGQSGVVLANHARGNVVYGNLIRFNGMHGVSLRGLPVGEEDVNHGNVVENNHIHHCGELVGHGYGIRISQSGHNRIVHNHIHHMPRYGTSIKGMYYTWMLERLEGVTWENHWDYLHSRNNLLAYNHIHHVNLDSQDTGAMESWGSGRDNIYDHNLIHDTGNGKLNYQKGIYLDGGSDYWTVTNNIIYGVIGAGQDVCISANGVGNVLTNNILVVEPGNLAAIHTMELQNDRTQAHEYSRNIIFVESREAHVYTFTFWEDDFLAISDRNVFWKPLGDLSMGGGPALGPIEAWLGALDGRFDQNSIIADPIFVNAADRDFKLRLGSPAFAVGFEQIDVSEIGLKQDFPPRLSESIEEEYRIPLGLAFHPGG